MFSFHMDPRTNIWGPKVLSLGTPDWLLWGLTIAELAGMVLSLGTPDPPPLPPREALLVKP